MKHRMLASLALFGLAGCAITPAPIFRSDLAKSTLSANVELLSVDTNGLRARFSVENRGNAPLCLVRGVSAESGRHFFVSPFFRRMGDRANFAIYAEAEEIIEPLRTDVTENGQLIVQPQQRVSFLFSENWTDPRPMLTMVVVGAPAPDARPFRTGDKFTLILAVTPNDCPSVDGTGPNNNYALAFANTEFFEFPSSQ